MAASEKVGYGTLGKNGSKSVYGSLKKMGQIHVMDGTYRESVRRTRPGGGGVQPCVGWVGSGGGGRLFAPSNGSPLPHDRPASLGRPASLIGLPHWMPPLVLPLIT